MNGTQAHTEQESSFRLSRRSLAALILIFGLLVTSLSNTARYFIPGKLVERLQNRPTGAALDDTTRFLNSFSCLLDDLPRDQVVGFWSPLSGDVLPDHFLQYYRMAQYAVAPVRLDAVGAKGAETATNQFDTIVFDAAGLDSVVLNTQQDYPLIIAFAPDNPKSSSSPLPGYTLLESCGDGIYLVSQETQP